MQLDYFDFFCFHCPFGKQVEKAFLELVYSEGKNSDLLKTNLEI